MKVFLAISRVQFEGDKLLGVFSNRDNAEFEIGRYLRDIKDSRQITDDDELLFSLAAEYFVDVYETDGGKDEADSYGLTTTLLKELLSQ